MLPQKKITPKKVIKKIIPKKKIKVFYKTIKDPKTGKTVHIMIVAQMLFHQVIKILMMIN